MVSHKETDQNDIPFSKIIAAMSSIVVDTFLRTLSIAYLMTFFKVFILLLPLMYFVLMVTIICIMKKTNECINCGLGGLYTIISFACSAFEGFRKNGNATHLKQDFKLRPISKTIYAIVLIGFSVYFGITIAPRLLENSVIQTNSTLGNSSFVPQD